MAPRRAPGLIPSLLTALVAGLAVVLSACADGSSAGASGGSAMSSGEPGGIPGGAAAQLAGRTFLSTSVTGHDLVDGSRIGITFRDGGTVEADAGCNSLSGPYRIEDGTLNASGLSQTEMGCDQDLMDQDTWFSGLLASGLAVDLNGDVLTLTGKEVTIQLTDRRVVDPDRPLEGTTWVLSGIVAGTGPDGTAASVPQGITATLRIADGKIHFFDGLNDSEGAITVAGETVHVDGDVATSAVGCATGSTCSVDMSLLTQDFTYRITAGQLTVTGTGKYTGHGLMFTAQDLSPTSSSTMPGGSMSGPTTTMAPASPDPGTGPSGSELPPPAGSIGGSDVPAPTAQPGPTAAPGTASELTSSVGPRTEVPGRHDSIPPQPSPGGTSDH